MDALIVVDVQNDFVPGGSLAVTDGDAVVPVVNALMPGFGLVVATQDWHPANHGSFATSHPGTGPGDIIQLDGVQQVLWPPHCVQGTSGASFHSALAVERFDRVVRKGTDEGIDSYSGFFDNGRLKATGLDALLRSEGVGAIFVCGLATDYCVKFTALDARDLGFTVRVVGDACRAVNLNEGDGLRALDEMRSAGCSVVESADVLGPTR